MTHVTCRLTVKNRDQLRNPTLGNRVWATFFTTKGKEGRGREGGKRTSLREGKKREKGGQKRGSRSI